MNATALRKKSVKDLQGELAKLEEKLATTVRERRTTEAQDIHDLRKMRKDIARMKTVINESKDNGEEK